MARGIDADGTGGRGAGRQALWPRLGTPEHARRCIARAADTLDLNGAPALAGGRAAHDGTPRIGPAAALQATLHASITAYVRRLRADGLPPERVLVRVKHTVYEAAPRPLVAAALLHDVVRWTIDAYFAP